MTGTLRLVGLLIRRQRLRLGLWIGGLLILVAVTVPGYASTYPALAQRGSLVHQLRDTVATKVLYGPLPLPGTLGQLAQWETGTYVVLLVSVMGVLLTVSMTRGDEDRGLSELAATCGIGRRAQPCAVALLLSAAFAVLGAGIAVILSLESIGHPGELTVSGAWCFGAVVCLVGLGTSAQTMVFAEVMWDVPAAARAAWSAVAIAFVLRVLADFTTWHQLRWVSWFGLKDLVGPYTADRVGPLLVAATGTVVLAGLAASVHSHREFGAGLIAPRAGTSHRLHSRSAWGLAWRLDRMRLAVWALPTIAVAALFGGMSHGLITLARTDANTATMMRQLTAETDPARQYFTFTYVFIALLPLVYGVGTVLRARTDEHTGLLDAQLTVGVPRLSPLAARCGQAAAGAVTLLLLGAAVQAATAALVLRHLHTASVSWAFWAPAAQAAGCLAAVGCATGIVGALPRMAPAAWAVVVWSGFTVLLGHLAHLPPALQHLSLLGHLPDSLRHGLPSGTLGTSGLLIGIFLITVAAGSSRLRRRDIVVG